MSTRLRPVAAAIGLAGLAVLVLGTFLPWLDSGRATRNSYQAGGLARQYLYPDGVESALFRAWPALGLVVAAAIVAYAFGRRPLALGLAVLAAAAGLAAGVIALERRPSAYASVDGVGPAVTIAGAVAVVLSVIIHVAAPLALGAADRMSGRTLP